MAGALPTVPLIGSLGSSTQPMVHSQASLRITVCAGPEAGRVFESCASELVIGRNQSVDVRLSDPSVSQFHVSVHLVPTGVAVRDMGSLNGVFMGGVQLERAVVPVGTLLRVGNTTLKVDCRAAEPQAVERVTSFGSLVGKSECMQKMYARLAKLAPTELSILIEGETGTGKEVVARSIYEQSPRARYPFVVVDCTTLVDGLAASLLFGHERGAFSGAHEKKIGLFQAAQGGVLFLDEIGELSPSVQAMLLRAVQHKEVLPVGSTTTQRINVRILCATLRDLRAMVNTGRFREDLFYRLAEATVRVPALSERREDIPLLVEKFLDQIPRDVRAARALDPAVLSSLTDDEYPGNVRELRTMVRRLAQLADGPTVTLAELMMERHFSGIRGQALDPPPPEPASEAPNIAASLQSPAKKSVPPGELPLYHEAKQTAVAEFERSYLEQLMARADNKLLRASALAGIERQNLRALLRKHGLYVPPIRET